MSAVPDPTPLPSLVEQREWMEDAKRKRAKEDFINLGMNASVNKLFEYYRDTVAPEYGREHVPSLHKPDLLRWAREDKWYEALKERVNDVTETKRRDYEAIRSLRFDDLHDLSEQAVKAIRDMLTSEDIAPKDFKAKTDVAFEVLDRIGITSKKPVADAATPATSFALPPSDADDNDLAEYLLRMRGKKA